MPRAFLSYARQDRTHAKRLLEQLTAEGFQVFWDQDTPPAKEWPQYLAAEIRRSDVFILLVSPNSLASEHVQAELKIAQSSGTKLIPVTLPGASASDLPTELQNVQTAPANNTARVVSAILAADLQQEIWEVRASTRQSKRYLAGLAILSAGLIGIAIFLLLQERHPPIGSIVAWPGASWRTAPGAWMDCHGQELLISDYAELHAIIGNTYGGDSARMNLPNYQGQFLRGASKDKSEDPDAPRVAGNKQGHAIMEHTHHMHGRRVASASEIIQNKIAFSSYRQGDAEGDTHGITQPGQNDSGVPVSSEETRPVNTAVRWIIRVE